MGAFMPNEAKIELLVKCLEVAIAHFQMLAIEPGRDSVHIKQAEIAAKTCQAAIDAVTKR